jgi:hypothetical protein
VNKLKLRLDDLAVDGFRTTPAERGRGTVRAEQGTHFSYCTCNAPTCGATCPVTCDDATCAYTCDDFSCAESCGGTCWNPRCNDSSICP